MEWNLDEIVKKCSGKEVVKLLKGSRHGLERECLRVDANGVLSQKEHPAALGSLLTHPHITVDFSESQLELVTPPYKNEKHAITFLREIHQYINSHTTSELIWTFSTPCILPPEKSIPIAYFGESDSGIEKHLYRCGLSYRYGRQMQTLSGIHYNFSFSDPFWSFLHEQFGHGVEKKTFISDAYLHTSRNYLRYAWLNTYLFGATPVLDRTYFNSDPKGLEQLDSTTYYLKHATSLRMSRYGYFSKVQAQVGITYNDIEGYIRDLQYALKTPSDLYSDPESKQLNDNILQLPAEHYARIRPKPKLRPVKTVLGDLLDQGVAYVETRDLDVNPFTVEGVELNQIYFVHVLLVYCLFKESLPFKRLEELTVLENQDKVSLQGRKPGLMLKHYSQGAIGLKEWALEILDEMSVVAQLLDCNYKDGRYTKSVEKQREKILDPELTLSAKVLKDLKEEGISYRRYGLALAEREKSRLDRLPLKKAVQEKFEQLTKESFHQQKEREVLDDFILKGYEDMEFSTQMIIREAKKRKITIEILDRKDCFLRLSKGGHTEYVKMATFTNRDSVITYLVMENKVVSKHILKEKGFRVPEGDVYYDKDVAYAAYDAVKETKIVVKPVFTNYGIAVHIISPKDKKGFFTAVDDAFQHGHEIIIEEYCSGEEFRFLVIGDQVKAVCQRIPSNVIGDGKHTIRELIHIKNSDPWSYKIPKYRLRCGKHEREFLKREKLTLDSIPKKGRQVFLRGNSNVSTGGDPIDVTDLVHDGYKKIALKASKEAKARFCGVDIMIQDKNKPPTNDNHAIIELNFNPALSLHRYPISGKIRYVEKDVLDELGF